MIRQKMAGGVRVICPDCFNAKVSQQIEIKNSRCPDCGGRYKNNKWISAPTYTQQDIEYTELMSVKKIGSAVKSNGVWRNRDVLRVG